MASVLRVVPRCSSAVHYCERPCAGVTTFGWVSSSSCTTQRARSPRCSTGSRSRSAAPVDHVLVVRRRQPRRHLPRRPRLPGRRRTCRSPSCATAQPRLRRQPEGRLPLGHRARPRHRRAAARRRAVRARGRSRTSSPRSSRSSRRGVRVAHDGAGRGPRGRDAAVQVRRQPDPHDGQNALTGLRLTEWHCGYRAYRVAALADIPFDANSDGFDFDTEIILSCTRPGRRSSRSRSRRTTATRSATSTACATPRTSSLDVARYRARRASASAQANRFDAGRLRAQASPHSSHGVLLEWLRRQPPAGCSTSAAPTAASAQLVREPRPPRHRRRRRQARGRRRAARRVRRGRPQPGHPGRGRAATSTSSSPPTCSSTVGTGSGCSATWSAGLRRGGSILVSIPNFAHWYPRARVLAGRFDYDQRGLLDRGHVRFFTRRSFEQAARRCELAIARPRRVVGSPIEVLDVRRAACSAGRLVPSDAIDRLATRVWPTLFGYQFLYEIRPV